MPGKYLNLYLNSIKPDISARGCPRLVSRESPKTRSHSDSCFLAGQPVSRRLASGSTQLLGSGGTPKEAVVDGVLAMFL